MTVSQIHIHSKSAPVGQCGYDPIVEEDHLPSSLPILTPPTRNPKRLFRTTASWVPQTKWTKIFAVIALAQALCCVVLFITVVAEIQQILKAMGPSMYATDTAIGTVMPMFPLAFEPIYQLLLALSACRARNTVKAIGMCINQIAMLVLASLSFQQLSATLSYCFDQAGLGLVFAVPGSLKSLIRVRDLESLRFTQTVGITAAIAIGIVTMCLCTWKLHAEFSWGIYRHLHSADKKLRQRYLTYETALSHLNFFFSFGYWMQEAPNAIQILHQIKGYRAIPQIASYVSPENLAAYIISLIALTLALIQLPLALWSAAHESKAGQSATLAMLGTGAAFLVFDTYHVSASVWEKDAKEEGGYARLLIYDGFAMVVVVLTGVWGVRVLRNFGKGIKQHLRHGDAERFVYISGRGSKDSGGVSLVPLRMEIE